MTAGVRAGMRLGWTRIGPAGAAAAGVVALLAAIALASIHRRGAPLLAPDRALHAVLVYVTPLAAFALAAMATGRQRLGEAVWCLARHGMTKRDVALGLSLTVSALSAIAAFACADVALAIAFGDQVGMLGELVTVSWIAALAGAAHAAWFVLGSVWLRGGRGRWLPLAAHFTIAGGSGALAFVWPRAHVDNLLGGGALDIAQPWSSALLPLIAATALGLALWRVGR